MLIHAIFVEIRFEIFWRKWNFRSLRWATSLFCFWEIHGIPEFWRLVVYLHLWLIFTLCWRLTWFSQTCNSLTLPVFCACSWSCPGGLFGLFRDFRDLILEFYRSDLCIPEVFLCSSWDTRIVGGFPLPQRFSGTLELCYSGTLRQRYSQAVTMRAMWEF